MQPVRTLPVAEPRESRLSTMVPQGIAEVVERKGISREELFASANVDPAIVASHDAEIARSDVYRLCDSAMTLTREPALGLTCAERLNVATFNPLSHLIAHSTTLGEGFESLCKFSLLICRDSKFQLIRNEGKVTLRHVGPTTENLRIRRFWSEFCMASILRMIHSVSPAAKLERLNFAHSAPEYRAEYTRVFERPVYFDEPYTELVLDQSLMTVVSPHRDPDVHSALRAIAERRLRDSEQRSPYTIRVREALLRREPAQFYDMPAVARSLGVSSRTLRRRLADEGKTYAGVVREAREITARHYLSDHRYTIQEVAYRMGYTDATSFHRAFKRWTGITPAAAQIPVPLDVSA